VSCGGPPPNASFKVFLVKRLPLEVFRHQTMYVLNLLFLAFPIVFFQGAPPACRFFFFHETRILPGNPQKTPRRLFCRALFNPAGPTPHSCGQTTFDFITLCSPPMLAVGCSPPRPHVFFFLFFVSGSRGPPPSSDTCATNKCLSFRSLDPIYLYRRSPLFPLASGSFSSRIPPTFPERLANFFAPPPLSLPWFRLPSLTPMVAARPP